jgi:streptomycin 6-kinase
MPTLPADFTNRIVGAFGDDGAKWLRQFPETFEHYVQHWSLTPFPHFEPLSYNFVAPAIRQIGFTEEVVLKLGVPNPELTSEIEALRLFDGRGAVRLLEADAKGGALLLERIKPGEPLVEMEDDEKATEIAAQVMQQLWRPLPDLRGLRTIEDWARGLMRLQKHYDGGTGPFPKKLVEAAEILFAYLIVSTDSPVVLHGDLHHWNILSSQRDSWLALDPKGVLGDPAFEVAAWMHNPFDSLHNWPDLSQVLSRRLDQFSEILGIDRQRLHQWSLAQSVLSAWWCIEDNSGDIDQPLAIAEIFYGLK